MPAFARSPHGLTDEELREKERRERERRERLARQRADAEAAANVDTFEEVAETPPHVYSTSAYVPVDKPEAQAAAPAAVPVATAQPAKVAETILTRPGTEGGSMRMPSTPSFVSGARNINASPLNFTPETFANLPEELASRGVPVEAFEIAAIESQKSQAMHKQATQNITPDRAFEIDYSRQSEIENRLTPMRFGGVSAEENRIYGRPDLNLAQAQQMTRDRIAARAQKYIDLPENINAAESVRRNSGSMIFEAAKQGISALQGLDPDLVKQYWANGVQSGLNEVLANVTGAKEALATLYMMMPEGGVYHSAGKNIMVSAQDERRLQDAFREQMARGGFNPESKEANHMYQIIQAVGGSALVSASTAALAMTAGLPIALSTMGAQVFNTTLYNDLKEAEKNIKAGKPALSGPRILEGATVTTLLEIGTELPMLSFLKKIAKVQGKGAAGNLVSNMIKAAGIEAVAEGFNEAASMTYEAMRNGATFTDEQIANNLIVAMGAGGAGGSALGGVTSSVAALTKLGIKTFGKTDEGFMSVKDGLTNPNATIGQQNDAETARNLLIAKLKEINPDAIVVTGLHIGAAQNGEATHDVGKINEDGVAEIYIDDILMLSRNSNQAMQNLEMAARHEGGHVLLQNEDSIRDAFFENNKKEILDWLANSTEYDMLHMMLNTPSVTSDPLALQRLATEEFIMAAGEKDIKLTDKVKLATFNFARSMGINVSAETNARLLLEGLVKGDIEALRAQAESGGLIDPKRRDVLKAGVAVGAGLALEPGGMVPDVAAAPVEATSQFAGGIMRPGVAPEMEGVLRAGAADAAAPTSGILSDVARDAFDDYDTPGAWEADQRAVAEERAETQRRLDELKEQEKQEEKKRIPQKWQELDTESLQTLAEANRAKDNPIWQAQFKELERRKAADETAATEVEEFETIGLEEARLETQKQIDTFNQQLDDFEASVDKSWGDRFSKKLSKTRRDTNDDWQKRFQPKLEGQELEIGKLVHRLNNATHMKGRASIGLEAEPLDRAGFRAIMTDLMNGETGSAIAFVDEQRAIVEQYTKAKKASAKEAAAERYAQRVGKDRSEVAPRRAKGTVSELEGIMTPALAKKEIDAQLEAGDIDQAVYDTKLERIQEIQKTVKGSGTSTQQKRKLLTEVAIGTKKIGRVPLDEMEREGFIGKREPNIPVEETTAPRSKVEISKDLQAAYEEARAAGKVKVIPPQEGVAEEAKAAFDKGTTKKSTDSSWNLPSESMFESRDYDAGEFTTTQGEVLGEGFTGIEAKSTKLKVPSRKGSIEVESVEGGKVKYTQKIPGQADQTVTTSEAKFKELQESGYLADYAVSHRVSKGFKDAFKNPKSALYKWAKENPEYEEGKYWSTPDAVLVSEWVKGFEKPGGYQLLEEAAAADGVTVPNELSRAEGDRMSPADPLVRRAISRAKDLNQEYESVFGKNAFAPDHVVEMLGYKIFGDGTRSFPRGVNTADNVATIPKIVHDAINDWPKAATTPAERVSRKNSPNKIRDMLNDPDFLNSKDKYKGIAKFLRDAKGISKAVDKYGKPDPIAQEVILLNATADLLGIKNDLASRPWNAETFTGTLTRESEGLAQSTQDAFGRFSRKLKNEDPADTQKITADFTSNTLRTLAQYVFGAPVKRITDFNKLSALGVGEQGNVPMATTIGNLIQRSLSSQSRPEGMEQGTDLVQETSLRTGEFYSRLFKVFAGVTNNGGIIPPEVNAQIVDYIAGKPVEFTNKQTEAAAKELKTFMEDMYKYAKDRTAGLETPLDLRGAGDSVLPRVWNIDYIATRGGKRKFLEAVANKFTDPAGKLVFEEANITPEDLYAVVVNSGGFVQGEWTNIKADQTTSKKEIEKDQLIQEYLDSLSTEELAESGLLVDDLQSVIPRFVQKAVERTEYSAVFGVNDELLRGMVQTGVDQIKAHNEAVMKMEEGGPNNLIDDKAFQKAVWDMSKILRNKFGYDMADMPTRKWLQRIANVEVVAKLPLVTLASLPEFFTPMLKGDVRPDKFAADFVMASAWAGYKGMNGLSKLLFNRHLPAMLKHSSDIEGLGIISDIQLLREMGIADIQAMGDSVATRYANPNFARGGIRATTKGTVGGKIPKPVRAVFNMQTYMQATMLTTITEMQQFMALRNYQRHVSTRVKAINDSKGKKLKGKRAANRIKQYKQDLLDYGLTEDVDLSTPEGEAAFNAGALRFIDQVITRPNDATTAKIFKNPLTAPLVLFKRFITTYGNTLLTSVGADFATKIDNVERAKQVGKLTVAAASMYGAVIFAEIIRGAIKGDLDDKDFDIKPEDWKTFLRRVDRMGVLSAPGSAAANLTFPSKAWYGDTGTNRLVRELTGPFGSDMAGTLDFIMSKKGEKDLRRLLGQVAPISRSVLPKQERTKKKTKKSLRDKKKESKKAYAY